MPNLRRRRRKRWTSTKSPMPAMKSVADANLDAKTGGDVAKATVSRSLSNMSQTESGDEAFVAIDPEQRQPSAEALATSKRQPRRDRSVQRAQDAKPPRAAAATRRSLWKKRQPDPASRLKDQPRAPAERATTHETERMRRKQRSSKRQWSPLSRHR